MDKINCDWLSRLSLDFIQGQRVGWIVVDAEHEVCGTLWLALVHRQSMGFLECPECGGRGGYTKRVYALAQDKKLQQREEVRLKRRWPGLEPIIYRQDGSIEERQAE